MVSLKSIEGYKTSVVRMNKRVTSLRNSMRKRKPWQFEFDSEKIPPILFSSNSTNNCCCYQLSQPIIMTFANDFNTPDANEAGVEMIIPDTTVTATEESNVLAAAAAPPKPKWTTKGVSIAGIVALCVMGGVVYFLAGSPTSSKMTNSKLLRRVVTNLNNLVIMLCASIAKSDFILSLGMVV